MVTDSVIADWIFGRLLTTVKKNYDWWYDYLICCGAKKTLHHNKLSNTFLKSTCKFSHFNENIT